MASSLSDIVAKDGTPATIAGGILAIDKSGAGTGPFIPTHALVDTQGVNTATIKAASTAAAATDTAIVVAVSPNNTIPVSIAALPSGAVTNAGTFAVQNNAATPAGTNVIGHVIVDSIAALPSGAVTNAGTFAVQNTAATPAGTNLMGKVELTDGTNTATVKAASTAPLATDTALVVAISPNSVNANGRALPSASAPVVLNSMTYSPVAASQTAALFGATGATGDYLDGVLIVPAAAAAGAVSITDGSGSAITVFAGGGTTALPTLAPFFVPIGAVSKNGAGGWKVTTGLSVSVVGVGNFT